ncbi:MAG: HlyC/CorC family transporter [Candidatus Omnitrophica bacterium]|nr:HlyC/CorC family transporter [Candidatus Omnitrophota bacterium]
MFFGYEILVIALMLFVNAVFASYEMALASISRARLLTLCQLKKRGSEEAAYMKDRMEASLAVVQLGITLAGAIASATGGAGANKFFTPLFTEMGISHFYAEIISVACVVVPLSAFTIIFAELVPKMFALDNRESVCLSLSPVMKAIAGIADPAVSFFEAIVKKIMLIGKKKGEGESADSREKQSLHELKAAAAIARTSRLIGAQEEKIVLSAAQLSQRKVADIMLDVDYISMIPVTDSLSDALIKAHLDMHTRFPVCEKGGDPQTIIGYLNFKDIVNALKMSSENPTVRGITRPIKKVLAETPLSQVLSEMMREKAHIALVISNEQKTLGLIALEDIIEELVGEIEDEFDRLPVFVQPVGSGWIIGGAVPMKVVASTLGMELPVENMTERTPTLAEWVAGKLGREIEGGEIMSFDNISVTVRKLRRRKLAEALVLKAQHNKKDIKIHDH